MTIVYPLQTQKDYTELRYSLRSVQKFIPGDHEIVIVSSTLPDWINNVTHIYLDDRPNQKQFNIKAKIAAAIRYAGEILFMNDDVYLLKEHKDFPYYYNGVLKTYSEGGSKQLREQLEEMNKPTKNFDGHYPLIYKTDFIDVIEKFTGEVIIKSMYCNYLEIEGERMPDNKVLKDIKPDVIHKFIEGKPCLSTGQASVKCCLPVLDQMFPEFSKFEI